MLFPFITLYKAVISVPSSFCIAHYITRKYFPPLMNMKQYFVLGKKSTKMK